MQAHLLSGKRRAPWDQDEAFFVAVSALWRLQPVVGEPDATMRSEPVCFTEVSIAKQQEETHKYIVCLFSTLVKGF